MSIAHLLEALYFFLATGGHEHNCGSPFSTVLFSVLFLTRASSHARLNHVHPNGQSFVVCRVSGRHDGNLPDETMGIKRALPRYGCQFPKIVWELSLFVLYSHNSPFCPYPNTVRILTLDVPPIPLPTSTRCCSSYVDTLLRAIAPVQCFWSGSEDGISLDDYGLPLYCLKSDVPETLRRVEGLAGNGSTAHG